MIRFLSRRFCYSIFVMLGVVTVVFFLFNVLPGDPARLTMGQRSDLATLENIRKEMNLDKPVLTRYFLFLNDLSPLGIHAYDSISKAKYHYASLIPLPGHKTLALKYPYLGRSYRTKRAVGDVLFEALPGTVVLALSAMIIATILGIFLGVVAAVKKGSWLDSSSIAASIVGISTPSFFAALLIAYLFGYLFHRTTGLDMTGSLWE